MVFLVFWDSNPFIDSKTVQRSALCRSRRELSSEYLLAKFGFDNTENQLCKVCRSPRTDYYYYGSPRCIGLITSEDRSQLERDFSAKEKKEAHLTPRSRMEGARPLYIPHAPTAPPVPNLEQTVSLYVFSNFCFNFCFNSWLIFG